MASAVGIVTNFFANIQEKGGLHNMNKKPSQTPLCAKPRLRSLKNSRQTERGLGVVASSRTSQRQQLSLNPGSASLVKKCWSRRRNSNACEGVQR